MYIKDLFKTLCRSDEDAILVTIVSQIGSSPRSAGAHMLITRKGRVYGTIGGGPVEYAAIQFAGTLLEEGRSLRKTYRLRRNDEEELGMICGGDVDVFFQYIQRESAVIDLLREGLDCIENRNENLWFFIDLTIPGSWNMKLYGPSFPLTTGMELTVDELKALTKQKTLLLQTRGRCIYSEPINTAGRVLIFGAGHVAQALEPVLSRAGFRCVVFDNRQEFLKPSLFSDSAELAAIDYEHIEKNVLVSSEDYLIVMTHNSDLRVLGQLISYDCAYLGAIGSKTKIATVKDYLLREGARQESLNAMNAPIGIQIRSETPEEIAISIAAELILRRAERKERSD
jgi:xanthine dehydrogenase accessory factor